MRNAYPGLRRVSVKFCVSCLLPTGVGC